MLLLKDGGDVLDRGSSASDARGGILQQLKLWEGLERETKEKLLRQLVRPFSHNLLQIQNLHRSHLDLNIPSIFLLNLTYLIPWQFSKEGVLCINIDFLRVIMLHHGC